MLNRTYNTRKTKGLFSVILPYISKSLIKQVLVLNLVFHINDFAQGFLDLTFPSFSILPPWKANQPNNLLNFRV